MFNIYIVAELAGDDSLAAIITYLKNNPKDIIIPTWVITPVELTGNIDIVTNNYNLFINQLKDQGYQIEELRIIQNHKKLWDSLMSQSFMSPCIACHLYCHLLRAPIAKQFNAKILTGERNKHNKNIKINQNTLVLNYFERLFTDFNFYFERPLLNIEDTQLIKERVKNLPFDTNNKNNYIQCSVIKTPITENELNEVEILSYLDDNLKPIVEDYINEYVM